MKHKIYAIIVTIVFIAAVYLLSYIANSNEITKWIRGASLFLLTIFGFVSFIMMCFAWGRIIEKENY